MLKLIRNTFSQACVRRRGGDRGPRPHPCVNGVPADPEQRCVVVRMPWVRLERLELVHPLPAGRDVAALVDPLADDLPEEQRLDRPPLRVGDAVVDAAVRRCHRVRVHAGVDERRDVPPRGEPLYDQHERADPPDRHELLLRVTPEVAAQRPATARGSRAGQPRERASGVRAEDRSACH
eukprot:gene11317-biopygen860